jgi:glycosyltransferase involved in cell wall biosynthesis
LNDQNKVPLSKLAYLPQHSDSSMIEMDLTAESNGVADFMFAGNLGAGQNLTTIIDAATILGPRPDYKVHFVGDGSQREMLEQMVKERNLQDNIIFHGNQKRSDMPSFYKQADVLLITLRGNNFVGNTMPGKLQMYMTTGKPILGAINGAANEVITESKCGQCVPACDHEGFARLMLDYIEHPESYVKCGYNARKYFMEHFTQDIYIDALEKELFNLI